MSFEFAVDHFKRTLSSARKRLARIKLIKPKGVSVIMKEESYSSDSIRAIQDYLSDRNPVSGLLVSGEWGAGKTYLLKKSNEFLEGISKKKIITLSVAGLSSRAELDQALFFASAPWLLDGHIQAAGVFVKAALRFAKIETQDFNIKAGLNSNEVAVILEDVDRFSGDLKNLFGFVVDLVDQSRVHTILVAAEDRLLDNESYSEWKEKIITQTVLVEPDVPAMVGAFINELPNQISRERLKLHEDSLKEIAKDWGLSNLRALRCGIRQIARMIDGIGLEIERLKEFEKILLCGIFLGVLEVGRTASSSRIVSQIFSHEGLSEDAQAALAGVSVESEDLSVQGKYVMDLIRRYPSFEFSLFPGGVAFHRFFKSGHVMALEIIAAFKPQVEVTSRRETFLRDYLSLDQAGFDAEYESLISDLAGGKIQSMGVIARAYLSLRSLADKNVIGLDSLGVKRLVLESIGSVRSANVEDPDGDDDFWYMTSTDSDVEEIKAAIELKREDAISIRTEHERAQVFISGSESLANRLRDWRSRPLFVGNESVLTEHILGLSSAEMQDVMRLFGARAQFSDFRSRLAAEKTVLLKVAACMESSIPDSTKLSVRDSQIAQLARAMRTFSAQLDDRG